VSSDGKFAFASNYGTGPAPGHTISMIDIAAGKKRGASTSLRSVRPHGLAFAGGKVYFTAEASKKIARYDPAADKIDWEFETGQTTTHMLLPMKDPRTIFTSNIGSDSVSMVEQSSSGWTQTVIPVGKGPKGSTCRPTAARSGARTRATAACR
jgi:DNA-binding beta-propeller fold protein YncE